VRHIRFWAEMFLFTVRVKKSLSDLGNRVLCSHVEGANNGVTYYSALSCDLVPRGARVLVIGLASILCPWWFPQASPVNGVPGAMADMKTIPNTGYCSYF